MADLPFEFPRDLAFESPENDKDAIEMLNRNKRALLLLTENDCMRCQELLLGIEESYALRQNIHELMNRYGIAGIFINSKKEGKFRDVAVFVYKTEEIKGLPVTILSHDGKEVNRLYGSFSVKGYSSDDIDLLERKISDSFKLI